MLKNGNISVLKTELSKPNIVAQLMFEKQHLIPDVAPENARKWHC